MSELKTTVRNDGPLRTVRPATGPRSRLALLLLAAALAPACGEDTGTLPSVPRAAIRVSVAPNPVAGVQDILTGAVSAAFTVSITETNGLGGEVVFVSSAVFDPVSGAQVALSYFDNADLKVFVGEDRIEPLGTLEVKQTTSYFLPDYTKIATLTVSVQFKDDRGNLLNESVLARIE
jgi:hypothetical protein